MAAAQASAFVSLSGPSSTNNLVGRVGKTLASNAASPPEKSRQDRRATKTKPIFVIVMRKIVSAERKLFWGAIAENAFS